MVDTDPGADDVFAILWAVSAAQAGAIELAALTTCGGNVNSRLTFAAAWKALLAAGCDPQFDVNVLADELTPNASFSNPTGDSHQRAWICPKVGRAFSDPGGPADNFMGSDGLGGLGHMLPAPHVPFADAPESSELLVQILLREPTRTVTIVALGPLTNLARAESMHPGILGRAKEVHCHTFCLSKPRTFACLNQEPRSCFLLAK